MEAEIFETSKPVTAAPNVTVTGKGLWFVIAGRVLVKFTVGRELLKVRLKLAAAESLSAASFTAPAATLTVIVPFPEGVTSNV
ncbi:hypothetical protein HIR72_01040 [Pasteurella multocida]|uniref:hypothetical protein n=1 Tax=Pasteurella multocida TaxID=747 RepID=UPI00146136D6|nr:hypothetical protein [Pasteurella multocida]NMR59295.1 hypothetical protein [Pasteurella multocida]